MTTPTPDRQEAIATARACDERISAAWAAFWDALAPIGPLERDLKDMRKRHGRAMSRPGVSTASASSAEPAARRLLATARALQERIEITEAEIAGIRKAAAPLADAARALDARLYTGWRRFYLVKHIHSSQRCSSFRPTTRVGWLPAVSGLTEAEAVAEYGAILCTICFPSAPVEWTTGEAKPTDGRCAGSGKPIDRDLPNRSGFYAGNWATCPTCGKQVGVARTGFRIPKHTPKTAAEKD